MVQLSFLLQHLAESTVAAGLLAIAAVWLRRRGQASAAGRHGLWLVAFAKFVVPSAFLWSAGTSLASVWAIQPVYGDASRAGAREAPRQS